MQKRRNHKKQLHYNVHKRILDPIYVSTQRRFAYGDYLTSMHDSWNSMSITGCTFNGTDCTKIEAQPTDTTWQCVTKET